MTANLNGMTIFAHNFFRKTNLMLGKPHIRMIWLGLYRSLPHREGGGGCPRQELKRQLRFAMRNQQLLEDLFLVHYNHDLAAAQRLQRRQAGIRARRLSADRTKANTQIRFSDIIRRAQEKSPVTVPASAAPP